VTFGSRVLALLLDGVLADIVAILAGYRPGRPAYGLVTYAVFLAVELVFVSTVGQTPGMRAAGFAVVRERDGGRAGVGWVLARTLLLATIVVALIPDRTGRPLHDRAAGTVMVRTR
jgi:uncharacterized RDD family membrane protein YckC